MNIQQAKDIIFRDYLNQGWKASEATRLIKRMDCGTIFDKAAHIVRKKENQKTIPSKTGNRGCPKETE